MLEVPVRLRLCHESDLPELAVDQDNVRALAFYERLGYAHVGTATDSYEYEHPDGWRERHTMEQWILRKSLAAQSGHRRPASPLADTATPE